MNIIKRYFKTGKIKVNHDYGHGISYAVVKNGIWVGLIYLLLSILFSAAGMIAVDNEMVWAGMVCACMAFDFAKEAFTEWKIS